MRELKEQQQTHLNRPSFSDESSEAHERKIEASTAELTRMLTHCNQLVQHIQQYETSTKRKGSVECYAFAGASSTPSHTQRRVDYSFIDAHNQPQRMLSTVLFIPERQIIPPTFCSFPESKTLHVGNPQKFREKVHMQETTQRG